MSSTPVEQKFVATNPQPFDSLGLFTYLRTYARRHNESDPHSTVESWQECLTRVVNACNSQLNVGFTPDEKQEFFDLLYNLKCSVAGRFLWQLGTRTVDKLGLMSLQNCAFTVIDSPVKPFTWIMNFLMLGAGCGYRISQADMDKFPDVKRAVVTRRDEKDSDYIVPDSRQGWIKLLGKLLKAHFYSGEGFTYSCHLLRSKGAPIKGFGGLSSGPEVLCDGIAKINDLLNSKAGQRITSVDALDIANIIGMIVVSGNVRRSAQIALGDSSDVDYMKAKRWDLGSIPNWRCYSNNSVICNDINEIIDNEDFWAGYNGNGEPYGLINLKLSQSCGRLGETQYADPNVEGYNPCISSDTWVLTEDGPRMVLDLLDKGKVRVYVDGKLHETTDRGFYQTRVAQLYRLHTKEGYTLRATDNHRIMTPSGWVPLCELSSGDKILIHNHQNVSWGGNGNFNDGFDMGLKVSESAGDVIEISYEIEKSSSNYCRGFLKGVNACRGYKSESLNGVMLFVNEPALLQMIQRILNRFGISCTHEVFKNNFLVIKQRQTFMQLIETGTMDYTTGTHTSVATFTYYTADGIEPVYDCTVPTAGKFDANSFVVSNCAEQSLARWETCCLGEIYLPNINTFEELKKCVTYIYRTCKHSLALPCVDSHETEDIVHKNFRMGIGITGYLQATETQRGWLKDCYTYLREYDRAYSLIKNFPPSVKLSTCKPSGCSRGDMLIQTNKGLMRLDEIGDINGPQWQDIAGLSVATDDNSYKNVTKFYVNGNVETKRIITEDGMELESSLNHRYRVVTTDNEYVWKTVEELECGDRLVVKLGNHPEDVVSEFKTLELKKNTTAQVMIQPKFLTRDIAWFLGLFYGDGSVHKKGIRISFNRKQPGLIKWLIDFSKSTFGLNSTTDDDHGFYINSQQLLTWLEENECLKDYAHKLTVPKIIKQSSAENTKAFIDGFWRADGGIYNSNNAWSVCSVSKEFAMEFFIMCRSVGYNVRITCAGPGGLGSKDRWIIASRSDDEAKDRYRTKEFKSRHWNGFWLDPIKSIESSTCNTYDIEVEDTHHYKIGGVISHNTLSILGHCTSGVHPGFAQYYIRRIRVSSESKLIGIAKAHGYHVEYVQNFDGTLDYNTQVISFPYALPEGTILAENCTAVQQLEYVKRLQTEWSDNAVSVTVYYRKEELPQIKDWLRSNYNNSVKTVSFLLHSDHGFKQAPLEKITREQYEEMVRTTTPITDVSSICYNADDEKFLGEGECAGGACPLK